MSEAHPITFRLKVFNAWRRGNGAPQPDPKTVGEDIDSICDIAKRLEIERDEWKKKFIQQNKDLGCEMMDPGGTIWDYAKNLQDDIAGWETKWKCAVDMAAIAENDRDELKEQLDAAIMLGKMQERRHERELEQVREQYRLSSVCRKLLLENQQLKESRQSPTTNQ